MGSTAGTWPIRKMGLEMVNPQRTGVEPVSSAGNQPTWRMGLGKTWRIPRNE